MGMCMDTFYRQVDSQVCRHTPAMYRAMCLDTCLDMCGDMYLDMCLDMNVVRSRHVPRHECRHMHKHVHRHMFKYVSRDVFRHVHRHVRRHVYAHVCTHMSARTCLRTHVCTHVSAHMSKWQVMQTKMHELEVELDAANPLPPAAPIVAPHPALQYRHVCIPSLSPSEASLQPTVFYRMLTCLAVGRWLFIEC